MSCRRMKSTSSSSCSCATGTTCPAAGWSSFALRPGGHRDRRRSIREATRRNSSCVACSSRIAIASSRSAPSVMPFVEPQLLLERLAPEAERALAARRQVASRGTSMYAPIGGDASVEASARSPSRCRSSQVAEGARQIVVDEPQRAAQALEPDLDEDAGRILDVVAGRLDQARHLAQLRQHAAGPLGERRVVEQRLPGQAGREEVGVVLRVALPGADAPRARTARARMLASSAGRSRRSVSVSRAGSIAASRRAKPPRSRTCASIACRLQILEQVVVQVHAVERRVGGMDLVELRRGTRRRNAAGVRRNTFW